VGWAATLEQQLATSRERFYSLAMSTRWMHGWTS
jgi:hypothetical protein